jgi:hypothetical protein
LKSDNDHWKAQFRAAYRLWRDLHPNERYRQGHTNRFQFSCYSIRRLAPGVEFGAQVSAMRSLRYGTWSFQVCGAIDDLRVSSLWSYVAGMDKTGLSAFDFDVLAASCLMDNQTVPPSPELSIQAANDEIQGHLKEYCRKIDRIWNFFGGFDAEHLPALAIWMIRNRHSVGGLQGLPLACAAYTYGDTKLSLRILANMEAELRERIRSGMKPDPAFEQAGSLVILPNQELVKEIATKVLEDIARLRGIIDRSHVH